MIKRDEIYDLYWYFACERQNIFIVKIMAIIGIGLKMLY